MVKRKDNIQFKFKLTSFITIFCKLVYVGIMKYHINVDFLETLPIYMVLLFSIAFNIIFFIPIVAFGIIFKNLSISPIYLTIGFLRRFIVISSVYIVFSTTIFYIFKIKPEKTYLICNTTLILFPLFLFVYCLKIFESRFIFVIFMTVSSSKIIESVLQKDNLKYEKIVMIYTMIIQFIVFKIIRESVFVDF